MEISQHSLNTPQLCMVCFADATRSCNICQNAFYCCSEHQLEDLTLHRETCKKDPFEELLQCDAIGAADTSNSLIPDFECSFLNEDWCQNNLPSAKPDELSLIPSTSSFDSVVTSLEKAPNCPPLTEDDLFSSFPSEFLTSANNLGNLWDLINNCEAAQDLFNDLSKEPQLLSIQEPQPNQTPLLNQSDQSNQTSESEQSNQILGKKVLNLMGGASLQEICSTVVTDLNTYGICVLDKFLGDTLGNLILNEVKNLYGKGIFKKGELVVPNPYLMKENIRSDVTMWANGTEAECLYIGHLMQVLDVLMTTCNKFQGSGALSKYKLHRRTKAMIACYPGDGTHYKKHIDNPHQDGRCVTCIYYLNQNWNTEIDGGMLRMFPSVMEDDIAEIEPFFDRLIFFWSDKRNPHEVLPAFRTRFAITVWYFDADERDRALLKARAQSSQRSMNLSRN